MPNVVVTFRIMPGSPDADLSEIELKAKKEIFEFCNTDEFKTKIEPIAFGLNALYLLFVMDENIGSTESLEKKITQIDEVESVEVTDVRRAIG